MQKACWLWAPTTLKNSSLKWDFLIINYELYCQSKTVSLLCVKTKSGAHKQVSFYFQMRKYFCRHLHSNLISMLASDKHSRGWILSQMTSLFQLISSHSCETFLEEFLFVQWHYLVVHRIPRIWPQLIFFQSFNDRKKLWNNITVSTRIKRGWRSTHSTLRYWQISTSNSFILKFLSMLVLPQQWSGGRLLDQGDPDD